MNSSAIRSSSAVVIPGCTCSPSSAIVSATSTPARAMPSISAFDFRMIMRREPIEDEPALGVGLFEPRADQLDHQVVRDEVAAVVHVLDAQSELRPSVHLRAQDLAARDVRNAVFRRDALCLGALARTLRAEEQDVQRHGAT